MEYLHVHVSDHSWGVVLAKKYTWNLKQKSNFQKVCHHLPNLRVVRLCWTSRVDLFRELSIKKHRN